MATAGDWAKRVARIRASMELAIGPLPAPSELLHRSRGAIYASRWRQATDPLPNGCRPSSRPRQTAAPRPAWPGLFLAEIGALRLVALVEVDVSATRVDASGDLSIRLDKECGNAQENRRCSLGKERHSGEEPNRSLSL